MTIVHIYIMYACLTLLALGGLAGFIFLMRDAISKLIKLIKHLGIVGCLMVMPLVIMLYIHGSDKPPVIEHTWYFEFLNGLHNAGSYCDEYGIHAVWTVDQMNIGTMVNATYQDLTITNELGQCIDTHHPLEQCLASELSHLWVVEGATNMRVIVWADYVQPPEVHTNGVYRLPGVMRPMDDSRKYLTPSIKIDFKDDSSNLKTLTPTNAPAAVDGLLLNLNNEL